MLFVRPHHDRLGWRDALLALALFAAIVRAFVPQGFMLSSDEGGPRIVLCTSTDMTSPIGPDAQGKADALAGMHGPCAFAGLSAMAPPPDLPLVSMAQAIERRLVVLDSGVPDATGSIYRPQTPRAPPFSV